MAYLAVDAVGGTPEDTTVGLAVTGEGGVVDIYGVYRISTNIRFYKSLIVILLCLQI